MLILTRLRAVSDAGAILRYGTRASYPSVLSECVIRVCYPCQVIRVCYPCQVIRGSYPSELSAGFIRVRAPADRWSAASLGAGTTQPHHSPTQVFRGSEILQIKQSLLLAAHWLSHAVIMTAD